MEFIVDLLIDYTGPIPYLAIFFILLICGLGVPIPEDITLFAGGILTYYGLTDVWIMIGVGLAGVLLGDSFMFFLGHKYGHRLMGVWPFRTFVTDKLIEKTKSGLQTHAGKLLFSARFLPGIRSSVFFITGMLKFPYWKLLVFDGVAALISVPAIVYSIYRFGDYLERVVRWIKKAETGILIAVLLIGIHFAVKAFLKKKDSGDGS